MLHETAGLWDVSLMLRDMVGAYTPKSYRQIYRASCICILASGASLLVGLLCNQAAIEQGLPPAYMALIMSVFVALMIPLVLMLLRYLSSGYKEDATCWNAQQKLLPVCAAYYRAHPECQELAEAPELLALTEAGICEIGLGRIEWVGDGVLSRN